MIDKEKFNFTENDVEKDGHVYCKICGERVDGETLDLPFAKFTPRVMCACDRKRKQADEERERLMKVSMLKNSCFISPIQTQYTFENYLKGNDQAYQQFALELSGVLYLGWLGAYSISLRQLPNGAWLGMAAVGLVMLVDLGAYIFGSLFGKHHFAPRLSPSKTWEGLAGGLVFGAGCGALIGWLGAPVLPELGVWGGLGLGALMAVISPFGDIFLSMLKRGAGVKDAGKLLPGIGGIMDRIDSWIWGMTVAYYFVLLLTR